MIGDETARLIEEWRKAMEGVTPFEWRADGDQIYAENHQNDGYRVADTFGPDWLFNAAWIARCSPAGIAALLTALASERERAERAEKERDEADRRAGASERRLAYAQDTINKSADWRDEWKERLGYDRGISFDRVWADTLVKAQALPAAEAETARLTARVAELEGAPIELSAELFEALHSLPAAKDGKSHIFVPHGSAGVTIRQSLPFAQGPEKGAGE